MKFRGIALAVGLSFLGSAALGADALKLAVTTSFHNSGLSDILVPEIEDDLGLTVQLIVVGTGQALKLGRAGDVDAILVHSRDAEEKFVAQGHGTHRREIMYNDFVVVGPKADPANIAGANLATDALTRIATDQALFVSRGDDSGTHRREMALWGSAREQPEDQTWYRSVGAGMGATLNAAVGMNAYVLSDRASWLNFGNKGDLVLLFQGDPALFNQYAFIAVDPERHAHVQHDLAISLENWLASDKAQRTIAGFQIDGQTLFTPNATGSVGGDGSGSN